MKKLIWFLLACSALGFAQNVRYDQDITSISSTNAPFIVANVPPNSPTLAVCNSPANNGAGNACTNYAQTFDSLGNPCPNGAQDTPQPQPSSCQSTADARGSIGFWAAPGTYDYTVCIQNTCLGPYTITLGGSGGGGGTLTGINTSSGSGLQGGGTSGTLNLSLVNTCGNNQVLLWNGTAWLCGNAPSIWSSLTSPTASLFLNLFNSGIPYTSTFIGGTYPAPGGVVMEVTDNSTATTDKTYDFDIEVPPTSYHHALNVSVDGFQQLQICSLGGASHLGVTVIGNIIPCANISISPVSKMTIMDNSPAHVGLRVYQNNASASADMMQLNTAAVAGIGFNFVTYCAGATSGGDTTCPSGNILASLRGDGQWTAVNYIGAINGVTISNQPASSGYCPISVSVSTATWQPCTGGGGGGSGAQYQSAYFAALNTVGAYGPGLAGQTPISQGSGAAPVFASQGVAGSTQAGSTYTVLCDSGTATRDRLTTIKLTNSAPTVTIPDPADSGCGANFTFTLLAATGVTATVNRETAATFTTFTGSASSAAQTTFTLTAGQSARFNSPDNANYNVVIATGGAGGSSSWSALTNPSGNLSLSTMGTNTSTFTYATALANAFLWQNMTAATLSTPQNSPVLKFCGNYWTGSAGASDCWTLQDVITAGTNGPSTLTFSQIGSSGVAALSVPNLIATSSTPHFVPIAEGSGAFAYVTPSTSGFCFLSNGTSADPSFQNCPAGSTAFPITVTGGVSGGIPYFSSATTEASSALLTANVLIKGGGAANPPVPSSVTDAGTTVVFGEGLQFSGVTGANTTISTSSANANLLLSPNGSGSVIVPAGSATNPGFQMGNSATVGFYAPAVNNIGIGIGSSHDSHNFLSTGITRVINTGVFAFSSSATDATTAADTGISRAAADVTAIGNGTAGDTSGKIKAAGLISIGTKFTSNGGCSESALLGGATAGQFTLGANACTVVVTMGNSATAPNGWACFMRDLTTSIGAGNLGETSTNATTATFTVPNTASVSDLIIFGCTGF